MDDKIRVFQLTTKQLKAIVEQAVKSAVADIVKSAMNGTGPMPEEMSKALDKSLNKVMEAEDAKEKPAKKRGRPPKESSDTYLSKFPDIYMTIRQAYKALLAGGYFISTASIYKMIEKGEIEFVGNLGKKKTLVNPRDIAKLKISDTYLSKFPDI